MWLNSHCFFVKVNQKGHAKRGTRWSLDDERVELDRLLKWDMQKQLLVNVRLQVDVGRRHQSALPRVIVALVQTLRLWFVYQAHKIHLTNCQREILQIKICSWTCTNVTGISNIWTYEFAADAWYVSGAFGGNSRCVRWLAWSRCCHTQLFHTILELNAIGTTHSVKLDARTKENKRWHRRHAVCGSGSRALVYVYLIFFRIFQLIHTTFSAYIYVSNKHTIRCTLRNMTFGYLVDSCL